MPKKIEFFFDCFINAGGEFMKGKLYRQINDGCIYEVIGQAEDFESSLSWVLWNERTGERQFVPEMRLRRQLGWDLVGRTKESGGEETTTRELPPALMK